MEEEEPYDKVTDTVSPPMCNASNKCIRWSETEDAMIKQAITEHKHHWASMTQQLPGRTSHAIRKRSSRLQASPPSVTR